jgi:hypothetical protein
MFGLFKSKTEKMVLKLERIMMAIEHFYEKGKYDTARQAVSEQLEVLKWLHYDGDWPEDKVSKFLVERGLVRSISDEKYREEIAERLMVF